MQVAFGIVAAKEIHHDPRGKMMGKGIKLFYLFNFFYGNNPHILRYVNKKQLDACMIDLIAFQ